MTDGSSGDMPTRVGIGLIQRGGAYLIRQRPPTPGSPMPGYWEFPGGKCEPGEPPEAAARRECEEELGVPVVVGALRRVVTHRYPHALVELHYFDCRLEADQAEPRPESGFRWVLASELPNYTFPRANDPIVRELSTAARHQGPEFPR